MEESQILQDLGRIIVGAYYDYQEVRKAAMNRIRNLLRIRNEGIDISKPEGKKLKKNRFSKEYQDKNIPKLMERMVAEGKLTEEERAYISETMRIFREARNLERSCVPLMRKYAEMAYIWNEWLIKIRGISYVLSANLIKRIGYCERFPTVSALWKYCGLDVDENGKVPKLVRGQKCSFNPKMRTLAWKIADSFIKQKTPLYRGEYEVERAKQIRRLEEGADNAPRNREHAGQRGRRKMAKLFLQHYWIVGRTMKNLPVNKPYAHDKLGHKDYIPPPYIDLALVRGIAA